MKKVLTILLVLTLSSCGYDKFSPLRSDIGCDVLPNAPLSLLRSEYFGEPYEIYDDLRFAGYVTANDASGNYYQSIVIEDDGAAVEVVMGFYDLHNTYHLGQRVVIKAQGLFVGQYRGVMQLGWQRGEGGWIDGFGARVVADKYLLCDDDVAAVAPMNVSVDQLSEELCGRLVHLAGLKYVGEQGDVWATDDKYDFGAREFVDAAGESIFVVTSSYAKFAGEIIPSGHVDVTGVLTMGTYNGAQKQFALKLISSDGVTSR